MEDYEINEEITYDEPTDEPVEPIEPEPPVNHIYTIKINNTEIKNLTMNGTNYVSEAKVDTSNWPPSFAFTATDENGNITEHYDHAKLIQQEQYDWDGGKFYLAFAPVSEQEIRNAELQAQLAAMEEANTNTEIALCEVYEMLLEGGEE